MLHTLKILMIVTSQATMGPGGAPTGVWFEELAAPYDVFVDAGAEVEIASVKGGRIPIDPRSEQPDERTSPNVARFLKDPQAMRKMEHSVRLDTLKAADYDAIFLPGGHGAMWDLPKSVVLSDLLTQAWGEGKVIAAVCHGPAGLVNVKDGAGHPLLQGRRVSAFSNAEEKAAGLADTVPFALESRLRELGAQYESGANFQPFAIRDGRLVTGQNPASSVKVARLTLETLRDSATLQ